MAEVTGERTAPTATPISFRDPTALLHWSYALLIICSIAAAIALAVRAVEFRILLQASSGVISSPELIAAAHASDARVTIASAVRAVFFLASCIPIGMWIYRAARNVRALGAEGLKHSPGWAVGSYFVPFANFVVPFLAMRDIWRASLDPGNWAGARSTPLLGWWWFLWLAYGVSGGVAAHLIQNTHTLEAARAGSLLAGTQNVVELALNAVVFLLLRRITANQLFQANIAQVF